MDMNNNNETRLRAALEQLAATTELFLNARRSAFDLRTALNDANAALDAPRETE